MRVRLAAPALAAALAWNAALAGPLGAGPSAADAGRAPEPAAAVASGRGFVDASLGTLDGGPLSLALRRAARAGRTLRLLLDPYDKDSRVQGAFLAGLGPTVRVRWRHGAGSPERWVDVEGLGALTWSPGGRPAFGAPPPGRRLFEEAWARAAPRPPRALTLNDQLRALPDPRERAPHYAPRAGGAP